MATAELPDPSVSTEEVIDFVRTELRRLRRARIDREATHEKMNISMAELQPEDNEPALRALYEAGKKLHVLRMELMDAEELIHVELLEKLRAMHLAETTEQQPSHPTHTTNGHDNTGR